MLDQIYYDAIVITDEIDPNKAGAVRIKVLGVTDDFDDKDQPFAFPVVSSLMAVPTKGTYLRVEFEDGDINQGRYVGWSPEKTPLPKEYVDAYPNVAVANLGGDMFHMVHNRASRSTVITHPSLSSVTWDESGRLTHDSDLGYGNAGRGAKNGNGKKIQPVLTGGTIDVFTCTPVGPGQGSEYLHVTHVSQATVNTPPPAPPTTVDTAILETGKTKPLNGTEVEFLESPSKIKTSSRDVQFLVVGITGDNDFTAKTMEYMDAGKNTSTHYLVGKAVTGTVTESVLPIELPGSSRDANESSTTENGFVQFVDILDSGMFGAGTEYEGRDIAQTSITVMVVGDGEIDLLNPTAAPFTGYQYGMVSEILTHVRAEFGDHVELLSTDHVGIGGAPDADGFDLDRVVVD
jgi:hypothetical protein